MTSLKTKKEKKRLRVGELQAELVVVQRERDDVIKTLWFIKEIAEV